MNFETREEWKDIDGFEGLYQVSNKGRVRSLDRIITRKLPNKTEKVKLKGKVISNRDNGSGYKYVSLGRRKNGKKYVHRLVASHFISNENEHLHINHLDHDRGNNVVENLEWCTIQENCEYKVKNNRVPHGTLHHRAKITSDDVREVRRLLAEGNLLQREIGCIFGISSSSVRDIKDGKTWRRVLD